MKTFFAAAAVAAFALGVANAASAAPAIGDGVRASTSASLVQKTGYHHRHRHCAVRHGHRHCWWG